MTLVVTRTVREPTLAQRTAYFRGGAWRQLVADIAKDMGDQARNNIIKHGKPSGDWPQLSGFNAAARGKDSQRRKNQKSRLRQALRRASKGKGVIMAEGATRMRASLKALVHLGYARRKATGKTPGGGDFSAGFRLRDTDAMFDGMDGDAKFLADGVEVRMVSRGKAPGRDISNDALFRAHATGAGNLPVRNPAQDMGHFEEVAHTRLAKFLAKAPK